MPRHLRAFIRRGVRPGDDPKDIALLALKLVGWWRLQWVKEQTRRLKADAKIAKLTRKKRRGRPPKVDFSHVVFRGQPGRPLKWTNGLRHKLYKLVEREREAMMRAGRARVTDLEALAAGAKRLRTDAGESISARLVSADARAWQPRYSEAKKLFGNPREMINK